jgi:hypothetical protein
MNKGVNDRHFVSLNAARALCDQQIYEVHPQNCDPAILAMVMNSTITGIVSELIGRHNFGEGVLWIAVYEAARFSILDPNQLTKEQKQKLSKAFDKIATRRMGSIFEEVDAPDRRALDDVIFDALKLTRGERDAVYEAVVELVNKRLEKAGSLAK